MPAKYASHQILADNLGKEVVTPILACKDGGGASHTAPSISQSLAGCPGKADSLPLDHQGSP